MRDAGPDRPLEEVGGGSVGSDVALSVIVPAAWAEEAGAVLMDVLGPFEEVPESAESGASGPSTRLIFYPATTEAPSLGQVLALLPQDLRRLGMVRVERAEVARDWVEGWRDHFRPIVIGCVRIRPPWEQPAEPSAALVDVVINPGLGFGTGLHPTTRGTLRLLQEEERPAVGAVTAARTRGATEDVPPGLPVRSDGRGSVAGQPPRGRLLDVGTGSGVLAIAAAKSGWEPVVALDNDAMALAAARDNLDVNGVAAAVELVQTGVEGVQALWSGEATVLANMTLEPVLSLLERLVALGRAGRPRRLVVSGILAGAQERELLRAAHEADLTPGRRLYEAEWVSLELLPVAPASGPDLPAAPEGGPEARVPRTGLSG